MRLRSSPHPWIPTIKPVHLPAPPAFHTETWSSSVRAGSSSQRLCSHWSRLPAGSALHPSPWLLRRWTDEPLFSQTQRQAAVPLRNSQTFLFHHLSTKPCMVPKHQSAKILRPLTEHIKKSFIGSQTAPTSAGSDMKQSVTDH